jgi:hypothetical protein
MLQRSVVGRRVSALALGTALTLGGIGGVVVAPVAHAYSRTVVEFRTSATEVAVGSNLIITLRVLPRVSNRVVTLQSSVNGRGGWKTERTVRTDRTGIASWSVQMSSSSALFYRAVVAGTSRYSPATSQIIKVVASKAKTSLTVEWPDSETVSGGDQIVGKVTPTTAGRNVLLEMFDEWDEDWIAVDSDTTDSRGLYDLTLGDEQGTVTYRVRVPATARATSATSDEVELTFDDGSGQYDVTIDWPGEPVTEDSLVTGSVSGLEEGFYDVYLEFVDPDTGEWSSDGTEGASVDQEVTDFAISFYGLSGYSGPVRLVIVDQYGDEIYASDPYEVDVL